ncbi:MAG: TetR/AcrR family transcriptional regulator [Solirubrobacterales bacterium]
MGGAVETGVVGRPLRRDAERNRKRILASAQVLIAEHGVDVSLDEIARHAGVGIGTAYRRFPDREALIDELLEDKISEIEAIAEAAAAMPDPWEGFVFFLERSVEKQAADRGLKQALLVPNRGAERLAAARARIEPKVDSIIARAQEAGALRPDFRHEDVPLVFEMVFAVNDATHDVDPGLYRRYLKLIVDGLATERTGKCELGHPALSRSKTVDAMCGGHAAR